MNGPAAPAPSRIRRPGTREARHTLADLGRLTEERRRAEREAARRAAEERNRQAAAERERHLFRASVGPVEPLKGGAHARRTDVDRPRPAPVARQRALDEAQALREAWSDGLDPETLIETDESLAWRRQGIGMDVVLRLRRGVWAIQAHCDLHGLRRDEARDRLAAFLREALANGLRCVRVVHGKGHGSPGRTPILKGKVRHWLVQKDEVLAFAQARAIDGGAGALLVLLRPSAGTSRPPPPTPAR